jgi:biopolymer transport protein ExbD
MAFSVGGNSGSKRRGRTSSISEMSEINIIPLVDVVLVLLIIFMLTAHVMEYGMEVEVPKVAASRSASTQDLPIVTFSSSGKMQLNEKEVNINELGSEIKKRFPKEKAVYLRADRKATWDGLAQVVSTLGNAKYDVKLVTQAADDGSKRR